LINILKKKIKDQQFFILIENMFNAGIITETFPLNKDSFMDEGVPQGNILSPLLSNIYFNELDQYVITQLSPMYTKGDKARVNPEYIKATSLSSEELT